VHFWPFDGWDVPEGKSVLVEVDPSILRDHHPKEDRTVHQQAAYSVAQWLFETDRRGLLDRYAHPPLTDEERRVAELEGWILGMA
jgi:hypothetical protein